MAAASHESVELIREEDVVAPTATEQVAEALLRPFRAFVRLEVAGGIALGVATIAALVWANSPWAPAYLHLLHEPFGISLGEHRIAYDLHHWINDALMAIFFFVVGLEIKREVMVGELADPRKAALPFAAAIGGMVVPAAVFLLFNRDGGPAARAWGVPMATDIAFALGALAVLGRRVPEPLKIFLVALAIVDDLGAVLVIAVFYTSEIGWGGLGFGAIFMAALIVANLGGLRSPIIYFGLGIGLWYGLLISGIHATLAGVMAAMAIPARVKVDPERFTGVVRRAAARLDAIAATGPPRILDGRRHALILELRRASRHAMTPLLRFESMAHPWVTFAIIPIFAFFNAGLTLDREALASAGSPVSLGIMAGLVVGKQLGVLGATWLAVKSGLGSLPARVTWLQFYGMAWLTGIGFTMSLFVSGLALGGTGMENEAKMGILFGSVISAIGGAIVLVIGARLNPGPESREESL